MNNTVRLLRSTLTTSTTLQRAAVTATSKSTFQSNNFITPLRTFHRSTKKMALPTHQKAIIFNTKTSTLSLNPSVPLPNATNELLIKVHSTAITNGELTWGPFVNWPENHVPCFDVSGTVVRLPSEPSTSHAFKEGDVVYGRIMANREGSAQEYANILPSEAALVPKGLDLVSAASVPMSANTAWQALFEQGLLTGSFTPTSVPHVNGAGETVLGQADGKRVLVLGAAGGVGLLAVQFAKLAGAYVAGTASGKNIEFLKGLGVDEVVDYTKQSVAQYIGAGNAPFDVVFDCVGGKSMLDGWNGVKSDGAYVSIVPGFKEPEGGKPAGVKSVWFVMDARGEELAGVSKLFEKGLLKATVDSVWKLEDYEKAFAKTASGHARGKVVFKLSDE